jgi:site-specific recombinase
VLFLKKTLDVCARHVFFFFDLDVFVRIADLSSAAVRGGAGGCCSVKLASFPCHSVPLLLLKLVDLCCLFQQLCFVASHSGARAILKKENVLLAECEAATVCGASPPFHHFPPKKETQK